MKLPTPAPDAAASTMGECRLCREVTTLRVSHVIPAFVFRWLKETSTTGFIRHSLQPNKRVQDGYKRPWLCAACEERLNACETQFATKLFYPWATGKTDRVPYGDWLLKFCVSLSWRVLTIYVEGDHLTERSDEQRRAVDAALDTWAGFLLGRLPHPGPFEQHFLPFDGVESYSGSELPPNINRYAARSVEFDLGFDSGTFFVFTKLGPFIVLGMVKMRPKEWHGTKVHVREGILRPGEFTVPYGLREYIAERARRYGAALKNLSPAQRAKVHQTLRRDLERFRSSGLATAMPRDIELFGSRAFDANKLEEGAPGLTSPPPGRASGPKGGRPRLILARF